ncbi:MAG TPA: preprotein translocase subunit SecG [Gemmatimonadales bacterium]|nr:preprotein translocase subunit SecG [Gemmatimonadales bacterium]
MFYVLLTLLIIDALVLAVAVLLQAGTGGGLASMGGPTTEALGGRQTVTILTKATWWTGGIFLVLSLILSVMSANRGPAQSSIQRKLQQSPVAPAPASPLPLQTTPPAGEAAPTAPTAPAPTAPATPAPNK